MAGALVYIILIIFILIRFMNQNKAKGNGNTPSTPNQRRTPPVNRRQPSARRPMASDGHRVPRDQDISCRQYGHRHEEFDTPRFIPHEDPEDGFIILNGVKMRLSEADRYEDRI